MGGNRLKSANVRIVAATNRDMRQQVNREMMRADFFYRIHILPIYLPPLRKRKEDLPLLIDHFMMLYGSKKNIAPIRAADQDSLLSYDWPGNVRELQNVILRYCHSGRIDLMGTSPDAGAPQDSLPAISTEGEERKLKEQVQAFEGRILLDALNRHRWHRTRVAAVLGIDRKTLFSKMKRYGLDKPA